MTVSFEMKELEQIIVIDFEEDYDEKDVMEYIASFYNEWLNFEETADEEMWGEIDNAMVDDWIVEHLNDYEYYVDSYEVKNIK